MKISYTRARQILNGQLAAIRKLRTKYGDLDDERFMYTVVDTMPEDITRAELACVAALALLELERLWP